MISATISRKRRETDTMIRYVLKRIVLMIPTILITSLSDLLGHGSGRRRSGNDHPAGKMPLWSSRRRCGRRWGSTTPSWCGTSATWAVWSPAIWGESYVTDPRRVPYLYGAPAQHPAPGRLGADHRLYHRHPPGHLDSPEPEYLEGYRRHGLRAVGVSMPNFWLGLMFILLFSIQWQLLPVRRHGRHRVSDHAGRDGGAGSGGSHHPNHPLRHAGRGAPGTTSPPPRPREPPGSGSSITTP